MILTIFAICFVFLILHLIREQLRDVLQNVFVAVGGALSSVAEVLREACHQARGFWARNFAQEFGVRPLLGGTLLAVLFVLFASADFFMIKLTIASLFSFEDGPRWSLPLFGRSVAVTSADLTALGFIAVAGLAGFIAFEALGWTDFLEFDRRIPSKARKALALGSLSVLFALSVCEAGLAAWRTKILQESSAAALTLEDALSAASGPDPLSLSGSEDTSAETPNQSWLDQLPVPVMAFFGFVFPIAAAVSAVGLYPLAMALCAIAFALLGMLPLVLAAAVSNLLVNVTGYLAALAHAALSVPLRLGEILSHGIERAWEWVAGARENAQVTSDGVATPLPPPPVSDAGLASDHSQSQLAADSRTSIEQDPVEGLEGVVAALNTNPFRVDDELLRRLQQEEPRPSTRGTQRSSCD